MNRNVGVETRSSDASPETGMLTCLRDSLNYARSSINRSATMTSIRVSMAGEPS